MKKILHYVHLDPMPEIQNNWQWINCPWPWAKDF